MWWAVDLLASEYGWAKTEIVEHVYFDELYMLVKQINRRKIMEYRMQLSIVTNPHVKEPRRLWDMLDRKEREIDGRSYLDSEFDDAGFSALKQMLQRNSQSIIVK